MTRLCKWCDTPLPKDSHHHRRYCVGDCLRKSKNLRRRAEKREYMREYYKRPEVIKREYERRQDPEVKRKLREYNQRPEIRERRREYSRKYSQCPEVKRRNREYERLPEVKERRAKRLQERSDERLLAVLLSMGVSDETMNEFGFERVEP